MKTAARIIACVTLVGLCLTAPAAADMATRVKAVNVEAGLVDQYRDALELVAFAPGSGWIRINSRDGIGTVLHLRAVRPADLARFNTFAAGQGWPLRVDLKNDALHLTTRGDLDFERCLASAPSFEAVPMFRLDPTSQLILVRQLDGDRESVQLALK